jgi:hypothetical protein
MTDTPPPAQFTKQLNVSPKTLLMITGGGLVAGTLIVLGAILPAEYNMDPLGLGNLSGISRLWAPDEKTWKPTAGVEPAHTGETAIQHNSFAIPLGASDWPEAALEYKFAMKPGQSYLYSWKVEPSPGSPPDLKPIDFDFHGHTLNPDGQAMTVADYKKSKGLSDSGSLSAPFDGIHGWYFKNTNPDPVTVKLEVWGFYTLIPPGQPGNEFRIQPLAPASAEPAAPPG